MALKLTCVFTVACSALLAHNIPSDFTVQMFVKPQGHALRLLVRAPLVNINGNTDLPLEPAGLPWARSFLEIREGGVALADARLVGARLSTATDSSFVSWDRALSFVTAPVQPNDAGDDRSHAQATMLFEFPIRSDADLFEMRTGIDRRGVHSVSAIRFLPPSGGIRAYELLDDSGFVSLDPRWYQAAGRFVVLGFEHIMDGTDHLLFVLCLVIPVRRLRRLIPVVTAFTAAHSITLIASASGFAPDAAWFPPLIEVLIAASILYMALENVFSPSNIHQRWMTAFGFGLVHGFGFSFALRNTLQFAGGHLLTSLLSFNVGVELGQIAALLVAIPILNLLFSRIVNERTGTIVISFAVALTAAFWLVTRAVALKTAGALPALIWVVAIAGVLWIAAGVKQKKA